MYYVCVCVCVEATVCPVLNPVKSFLRAGRCTCHLWLKEEKFTLQLLRAPSPRSPPTPSSPYWIMDSSFFSIRSLRLIPAQSPPPNTHTHTYCKIELCVQGRLRTKQGRKGDKRRGNLSGEGGEFPYRATGCQVFFSSSELHRVTFAKG